ncbi:MAG TPA: hypothetical protein VF991_21285 [Reyranella sp.]
MIAGGIPLRDLHLVWHELWPLLEPAVKRSPNYSAVTRAGADAEWLLARLIARDAQLWAVYEGATPVAAIITTVQVAAHSTSSGQAEKRCLIWLVGGSRLGEWAADFLAKVEAWARSLGCVALWGAGRKGWTRMAEKFGGRSIGIIDGQLAWERRFA